MRRRRPWGSALSAFSLAALALGLALILGACAGGEARSEAPAAAASSSASGAQLTGTDQAPPEWDGGTVGLADVPPEVLTTLQLIAAGGPYPYTQDGSTFQNREGHLPARATGFYREFTVETPGSPDRGARRLVVGDDEAVYYTDDHYDSFRFLVP